MAMAVHQNENRRLAKFENWQFVGRDRGFQLKAAFNRSVALPIRRRMAHTFKGIIFEIQKWISL